jgi:hypothetical protein
MAHLEIETADGRLRVPLDERRLCIGRLASNDVVLPYKQISRYHAEIRWERGAWSIIDLGSVNGLRVGDRHVARAPLRPGERVVLAPGVALSLVAEDASDVATLETTRLSAMAVSSAVEDVAGLPTGVRLVTPSGPARTVTESGMGSTADFHGGPHSTWLRASSAIPWSRGAESPQHEPGDTKADRNAQFGAFQDALEGDIFRSGYVRSGDPVAMDSGSSLYACQTCGQLTAPDAVACSHCKTSLAQPCPTCGFSLLPAQDRCPRCHRVNPASEIQRGRRRTTG